MLTSYPDEEAVLSAIVAGASGYLLKQIRARDLVAALESVGRGESLLDPAVTEKVLERIRRIATGGYTDEMAQLTAQEQKILMLVAEGKTNKEIAAEVFLSDKTVKNYVSSILSKLNLERRAQAAAFVAKHRHGSRRGLDPRGGRPRRVGAGGPDRDDGARDRAAGAGDRGVRGARGRGAAGRGRVARRRLGAQPAGVAGMPGHGGGGVVGGDGGPAPGADHATAVRELILRYGTPSEGLGSGPSFVLVRDPG